MGFIEAIGWLTIIIGGIFLILRNMSNRERIDHEKSELIANNDHCQDLINKFNHSVISGNPIMTNRELKKKLYQILSDPNEEHEALERIKRKKKYEEELHQEKRLKRKVGYKYEIEIFEIFDVNYEKSKKDLLTAIKTKYNLDTVQANELYKLWDSNDLIELCPWNSHNCIIGQTLTTNALIIDNTDLTREKWLQQNGKTLKSVNKNQ